METERTVLVVDDEPQICAVLADLLEDEGYRVHRAYDGRAALEEVDRTRPDLVVADVMMPRLNGPELVRHLRAQGDPTPVVLISAVYADVDLPGTTFVPKPFDLDRLLAVVDRVLSDSAPRASASPAGRSST